MTETPDQILRRTAAVVDTIASRARKPRKTASDRPLPKRGLAVDSLAKINLIIAVEEEFGFEIDEATIPASAFDTVATLAQFIHAQLPPP